MVWFSFRERRSILSATNDATLLHDQMAKYCALPKSNQNQITTNTNTVDSGVMREESSSRSARRRTDPLEQRAQQ